MFPLVESLKTDSDGKEKSSTNHIKIGQAHKFFGMRRSLPIPQ